MNAAEQMQRGFCGDVEVLEASPRTAAMFTVYHTMGTKVAAVRKARKIGPSAVVIHQAPCGGYAECWMVGVAS